MELLLAACSAADRTPSHIDDRSRHCRRRSRQEARLAPAAPQLQP